MIIKKKNSKKIEGLYRYRSRQSQPGEIYQQYLRGINYKTNINLFENTKKNENFFLGKQWEGVNAPNMDKPVFNVIKRIVNYFIANLVSDKIGMNFKLTNRKEKDAEKIYLDAVKMQVEHVFEQQKFSQKMRNIAKTAAVTGDGCTHVYFDKKIPTGHENEKGGIAVEEISSADIVFGNPMSPDVQSQPYIIVSVRRTLESVYDELEAMGKADICDRITPDSADNPNTQEEDDNYNDKVTVLTKYWKQQGKVWFSKTTKTESIIPPTCMDIEMYPICYMNWERQSNSMHGKGVVEEIIPNQIAINKMAAMAQQFIKQQAFPRVIYNKNKLPDGWQNGMAPIAVNGDPSDVVGYANAPTDMSAQVSQFFNHFIDYTRDFMGASDAALGNVNPDNTSAIIAVQKAAAVPLELVKQEYYQFVEDFVRICIQIMQCYYGQRTILVQDDNGELSEQIYDFGQLKGMVFSLGIDIGATSYWQETTDMQTLDNLYKAGLIDGETYVESLPAHSIPNRSQVVRYISEQAENAKAAAEAERAAQSPESIMPTTDITL